MQATLASACLLSSIAALVAGATFWWVIAGALLGLVIPFTLVVILPTNKKLLNPTLDRRSSQTGQLLSRWGTLHAVRTGVLGSRINYAVSPDGKRILLNELPQISKQSTTVVVNWSAELRK